MSVALRQFQMYMATIAPTDTVVAAQEGFKWLKTTFEDCSNVFEKMFDLASHVLTCNPSQFLTRVKYFQVFYSAAVDANANNTLSCGGGDD